MNKITIVVVDDHPLFRQGVVDSFSLESDLDVIGEATSGEEALALIRDKKPQVAVIDVNLPGINGQQVLRQISMEKLQTRVILLTAYDDREQLLHAMRGGAAAYCAKDVQPEQLVRAIHVAAQGNFMVGNHVLLTNDLDQWLTLQTESAMRPYGDPGEPLSPLSPREMEILTYVTRGMSNKEIATLLNISHQTVKNQCAATRPPNISEIGNYHGNNLHTQYSHPSPPGKSSGK